MLLLFLNFVDWQWCEFQYFYEGFKDKLGRVPSLWEDGEGYLVLDEEGRERPWHESQRFDAEGNVCVKDWYSLEIDSFVYQSVSEEVEKLGNDKRGKTKILVTKYIGFITEVCSQTDR